MKTIWNETVQISPRKSLPGNLSTDIAVIGAGMAGILTAFYLAQAGRQVIVLEADRIGSGQTKGTTAKITSQHGLIYQHLISSIGRETAHLYAAANQFAIAEYQRLIHDRDISCDFKRLPSYLYSTRSDQAVKREVQAARMSGIPAHFVNHTELPMVIRGAVRFPGQAQFHPLKFIQALSPSLVIYEKTPVRTVRQGNTGQILTTPYGHVHAKEVVFACHYPFPLIPGYYFMRMYQERSYVMALHGAPQLRGIYLGIDPDGLSFRSVGGTLLLGGQGHRTGKMKGQPYQALHYAARRLYPHVHASECWSAQDCMTLDRIPYIGRFSHKTPHWYVASGFGKWGMTSSMVAALLLTDLICGNVSAFGDIFSPQRFHIQASAAEFAAHAAQSARGLILGIGKAPTRCPHMGCKLNWNVAENTWECPCHGSRFDCHGKLLDGPAQTSL